METAESPLDVLSRAAVMLQRNVLPPPSYGEFDVLIVRPRNFHEIVSARVNSFVIFLSLDEARSLSQQQSQKPKLPREYKIVTNEVDSTSALTHDQIGNDLSIINNSHNNNNTSGKWKREKKHQQKTTAVASTCESVSNDKSNNKYSRR